VLASKLYAVLLAITLTVLFGGVVAYVFGGIAYGYGGWGARPPYAQPFSGRETY